MRALGLALAGVLAVACGSSSSGAMAASAGAGGAAGSASSGAGGASSGGAAGTASAGAAGFTGNGCVLTLSAAAGSNVDADSIAQPENHLYLGGSHGTFQGTTSLVVTLTDSGPSRVVTLGADFDARSAGSASPIVASAASGQSVLTFEQYGDGSSASPRTWAASDGVVTLGAVGATSITITAHATMAATANGATGTFSVELACALGDVKGP